MANNDIKGIGGFLIGGIVGACAALLFAPRSGAEMRSLLTGKTDEYWGQGKSICEEGAERLEDVYKAASEKAEEAYRIGREKADEVYRAGRERVGELYKSAAGASEDGYTVASDEGSVAAEDASAHNDELRAKIAEARKRIAEQIDKNSKIAESLQDAISYNKEHQVEAEGADDADEADEAVYEYVAPDDPEDFQ